MRAKRQMTGMMRGAAALMLLTGALILMGWTTLPQAQRPARPSATPIAATSTAPTPTAEPQGDAERGEAIFRHGANDAPGCVNCHVLSQGGFAIGPDLHGVAERAAEQHDDMSIEAYLHESIVEPGAVLAPGFRDMMYPSYGEQLTEADIRDLIAFLETL